MQLRHSTLTPATIQDAHELAPLLRPEDRREFEEVGGRPSLDSLLLGVLRGSPVFTARRSDGALAAMVGVTPWTPGLGVVWMAGTSVIEEEKAEFVRATRLILDRFDAQYDTLINVCDARNTVHVQWLRRTGFHLIRKLDRFGPNDVPVYEFARISPSHV